MVHSGFQYEIVLRALNFRAIANGIIPATANFQQADECCDLDYVVEGHRAGNVRRTLNLSFGFGGANAALILEKHV